MKKKKIIVVDDEKTICDALEYLLTNEGYEVITAHDGEDALLKVQDEDPDLVILDVMMPGMNGFKVSRAIRKDPVYKRLPILILTVMDNKNDKIAGHNSGADEYMVKPFELDELIVRVKCLLKVPAFGGIV